MQTFWRYWTLTAPLFSLSLVGLVVAKATPWRAEWTRQLNKFLFAVPLPALLFNILSASAGRSIDHGGLAEVSMLAAFFGGCFLVFGVARVTSAWVFKLNGSQQSVFAMTGVFSNNALLGIPLAKATLGDPALPRIAQVLVFNALTLWTLVTVSVEWARQRATSNDLGDGVPAHANSAHADFASPSVESTTIIDNPILRNLVKTLRGVLVNPLILAILAGTASGVANVPISPSARALLAVLGEVAGPLALITLGMGVAQYGVRAGVRVSATMTVFKLVVHPLVVWGLALALHLTRLDTQVVVLLASLAVGVNVYVMATQFEVLEREVATALVLSTLLAAISTPFWLAIVE